MRGVPDFVPVERLLGPGFAREGDAWVAEVAPPVAADVAARLRGVGLAGRPLEVDVDPPLPRALVRAARTEDARRRRDTTPGFERRGARLDEEGRISLTPEALAVAIGGRARGTVLDLGCGCGGNAIGFARAGCRVIAVERDAGRLALARQNARAYGVDRRIEFVHGDVADALDRPADLCFVDPPWGAAYDRARVTVDDLPPLSLVLATGRRVWAKVPPSFDPSTVPGAVAEAWFGEASGDRRRVKFLLLDRASTGTY